jgi:hypothetical protein
MANNPKDKREDRLQSLYSQRIPNSNLVIYDLSFSGSFVTDNYYTGFAILDSTVSFSREAIKELPCTYFSAKPTNSVIKMIDINYGQEPRTEKDTLLTPTNHYNKKVDNIQIDVTEYNSTYGSATSSTSLMEYEFDGIKETEDSLIFYKVTHKFGGKEFPPTTAFAKGNIKVFDSAEGNINYIDINQVVIKRGNIYKPRKPLELVSNQPIVGDATYRFYPRSVTKSAPISDYGIFKRVK